MKVFGTQPPTICNHARLARDSGDCELCMDRFVIERYFETLPPLPGPGPRPNSGKLFTWHPKVHSHRGHAEQIGRYGSPNGRKYEKRRANRLRRRAEKRDPANAPTRLIRGWND